MKYTDGKQTVEISNILYEANDFEDDHLKVQLLDMNRLVKVNNLAQVTNPVIFQRNNIPTSDGLLSNEIFGITMYDRSNTCAYIDLQDYFLNPIVYRVWSKLDKKIIDCIHGTKRYIITSDGVLEENEDGECGIRFLRKNFDKINIARNASTTRDMNVTFLEKCKKDPGTFINKFMVLPAHYRDVDTSKEGKIQVGEINELYRNLIIATKALRETGEYGLDMGEATRGRIQELLVKIFGWYGSGTTINGVTTGSNIPGKFGIIRRSVTSKTTDYATRLVMSAPELKANSADDIRVNLECSALPLASALSNFMPYIIFYVKRFFENAFSDAKDIPIFDKAGKHLGSFPVKDYQVQFSEERIKKEIDRFLSGISNRLIPVRVELVGTDKLATLKFKGRQTTIDDFKAGVGNMPLLDRHFTWCDIFYMAAVDVTRDKHIVITRYPFDSIYNQFATRIHINSTNETEPMVIDGVLYEDYPKIRQSDIGKNTSNMFIDTMNLSNLYLEGIGGDYDGDTVTVKGIYTVESNQEIERVMKANYNYLNTSGKGIRKASNECIFAMYSMTLVLPEDRAKLSTPVF